MKRWNILKEARSKKQEARVNDLISLLLENRGIKTKKEIDEFLSPKLEKVTVKSVGIDKKQLTKAIKRIQKAIEDKEQIVVFGDYDVDGICGAAILWETLYGLGANVMPYIPHRIDEGYGLSIKGIQNSEFRIQNKIKLIITVDNGIVVHEAVGYANSKGIDVIITDHHVASEKLPDALAIVHTTKLCGAGVAYLLAQECRNVILNPANGGAKNLSDIKDPSVSTSWRITQDDNRSSHLELVALATIADLVSLTGANRTLVKFGLEKLQQTKRIGLIELYNEAGIDPLTIDVYKVGHMIAPRLNAMGRMEFAMESLRLLCTKDMVKAKMLANKLGRTNKERQLLTEETVFHAKSRIQNSEFRIKKLLFIGDEIYQQGVIGLVAGKLVEEFYRPSIVVSIGSQYSKASARSVSGFNIIEFIRMADEHLVNAGGHPMAAGFTVETAKLSILQTRLEQLANEMLTEELLTRSLRIDCELPLPLVGFELYEKLQTLAPFGMGNPEPTFVSKDVVIEDMRIIGKDRKHLKFRFSCHPERSLAKGGRSEGSSQSSLRDSSASPQNDKKIVFDGIGFGLGERAGEFKIGDAVDIVYVIDENIWNGNKSLQLKIKDIKS